jgi:drug/metabolite transporter (DMT)-like permease
VIEAARPPSAPAWAPLLAVAVLCNGLAAGVWKHAGIDVGTFCVLFVVGKAVMGGVLWAARGGPSLTDRASLPFLGLALLAAVTGGLGWIAYFFAFERGPLAVVQSVTASYTALAALLSMVFLRERLSFARVLGVGLVVAGGALLSHAGEAKGSGAHHGGWLAASFGAAFAWGANAVLVKLAYARPGADDPRFFLLNALGIAATILPYGLTRVPGGPPGAGRSAAALAVALLYVAGDVGVYAALARGPGSLVNPLSGLYPIPAIAYGVLVLGDVPDRLGWLAVALVLPGVVLAAPGTGATGAPPTVKNEPTHEERT